MSLVVFLSDASLHKVHGHETEEKILFRSSQDIGRRIWDMPAGAPTEGVEQVMMHASLVQEPSQSPNPVLGTHEFLAVMQLLDNLVARQDKRQIARTQNCLGLMYAEKCAEEKAIPMMQVGRLSPKKKPPSLPSPPI